MAADFPLRILIAEDNVINQQVIQYILQKLGYDPPSSRTAVRPSILPPQTIFDIILMDLQMPEMDGLEATRIIRERNSDRQPVIIALTANTMEGDEEECLSGGNERLSRQTGQAGRGDRQIAKMGSPPVPELTISALLSPIPPILPSAPLSLN